MTDTKEIIWKLELSAADLLEPGRQLTTSQRTAAMLVVNELTKAATSEYEEMVSHLVNAARFAELAGLNIPDLQEYADKMESEYDRFLAERPDFYPGVG